MKNTNIGQAGTSDKTLKTIVYLIRQLSENILYLLPENENQIKKRIN